MTFHSKFKKCHAKKKTYTKHCKFNLLLASFTYSPSTEEVIHLTEIYLLAELTVVQVKSVLLT